MVTADAGRVPTPDRRHELWECGCPEGYIHSGTELRCDVCGKANPHRKAGRSASRSCRNEVEQPDLTAPLCTGTLTFHPGDVQAACDTCGGWEGVDAPGRTTTPHDDGCVSRVHDRMVRAENELLSMARQETSWSRARHLRSKAEGVALALSYLREEMRQ